MKYIARYENGYVGCNDTHFIIANNEEQAEAFMREGIGDYVSKYEGIGYNNWNNKWDNDDIEISKENWYNSQEYEEYFHDCRFDIWEVTEDDIKDWGINEDDWEDITK